MLDIYSRLTLEGPEADIDCLRSLVLKTTPVEGFSWRSDTEITFESIFPGCPYAGDYAEGGNDGDDCLDFFFATAETIGDAMTALAAQFPTVEGDYSAGNPDEDWCFHGHIESGQYAEGPRFEPGEQERICCGMPAEEGDDDYEGDEEDEDEDEEFIS